MRANPRTVVLFDEIEKAHPDVLRALMNAMDAGRLSSASSSGGSHTVDCRRAIFMFTSNIDTTELMEELEGVDAFTTPHIQDGLCRNRLRATGIPAELIGRINTFLVYRPLSGAARIEVITLAAARIAREYGVQLGYIQPSVLLYLLAQTHTEGYGARPYEYMVDDLLGQEFAQAAQWNMPVEIGGDQPPFSCIPYTMQNTTEYLEQEKVPT